MNKKMTFLNVETVQNANLDSQIQKAIKNIDMEKLLKRLGISKPVQRKAH